MLNVVAPSIIDAILGVDMDFEADVEGVVVVDDEIEETGFWSKSRPSVDEFANCGRGLGVANILELMYWTNDNSNPRQSRWAN